MSTYSSFAASNPIPGLLCFTLSNITAPSNPAFVAICFIGSSKAFKIIELSSKYSFREYLEVNINKDEYDFNDKTDRSYHESNSQKESSSSKNAKYDVYVDTVENPAIKYKEDISETECSILAENITTAGMYYVKVVAKHGDMTASSEVKSFEAKSSALANPVIAGVQTEPYATGNTLETTPLLPCRPAILSPTEIFLFCAI